jgi:large conductance mechanosensitive channel
MDIKVIGAARDLGKEFRDFLLKTNMFALALGVVIGQAVGKVVSAMVDNLIMPLLNVVTPKDVPWRTWAPGVGPVRFGVGPVLAVLLDFVIVASVVFLVTKALIRQTAPPPTKKCPECLEAIHPDARRCKFCTSLVQGHAP